MEKNEVVPEYYVCPISRKIMEDPVVASDGHTYERQCILECFEHDNTSPFTGKKFENKTLTRNNNLKSQINEFKGKQRIINRTTRNPVTSELGTSINLSAPLQPNFTDSIQEERDEDPVLAALILKDGCDINKLITEHKYSATELYQSGFFSFNEFQQAGVNVEDIRKNISSAERAASSYKAGAVLLIVFTFYLLFSRY